MNERKCSAADASYAVPTTQLNANLYRCRSFTVIMISTGLSADLHLTYFIRLAIQLHASSNTLRQWDESWNARNLINSFDLAQKRWIICKMSIECDQIALIHKSLFILKRHFRCYWQLAMWKSWWFTWPNCQGLAKVWRKNVFFSSKRIDTEFVYILSLLLSMTHRRSLNRMHSVARVFAQLFLNNNKRVLTININSDTSTTTSEQIATANELNKIHFSDQLLLYEF